MSDFSREARAYCRQHHVYFYPNDAGCEQCERDMENMADDPLENCVCETKPDDLSEMRPICKIYTQYNDYFIQCGRCGHLRGCHE